MLTELYQVRIWPDGTQQSVEESPYNWMSDDFIIRKTSLCPDCEQELQVEYDEPFAACDCGTTEWYY